jgi:hypothetical protein
MSNQNTDKQNIPTESPPDDQNQESSRGTDQELEPEQLERFSPMTSNPKIKNV